VLPVAAAKDSEGASSVRITLPVNHIFSVLAFAAALAYQSAVGK
jgi:hypothetical protein